MNALNDDFPNNIETPALPWQNGDGLHGVRDEWERAYQPRSPIERGWIEQALHASSEQRRTRWLLAVSRAETIRTAGMYWEHDQEDEVKRLERLFNRDPYSARMGLKRTAAGCRYLIACWERLETLLDRDGTWYGRDRIEAIQLQGHSAIVENLYFSEAAFLTWLHCLAAQPNPKQRDIDLILGPGVVPKALQDKDVKLWRPDPAYCREQLRAVVARELPPLRVLEPILRARYEEPARAAAEALAQVEACKDEAPLLRALQAHDRSFRQAANALHKRRNPTPASPREVAATLVSVPTVDHARHSPQASAADGRETPSSNRTNAGWLRLLRGVQGMSTRKRPVPRILIEAEPILASRTEPIVAPGTNSRTESSWTLRTPERLIVDGCSLVMEGLGRTEANPTAC